MSLKKVSVVQLAREFVYDTSYPVGTEVIVEVGSKCYFGIVVDEVESVNFEVKPVICAVGRIPLELVKAVKDTAVVYKTTPAAIFKKFSSYR